MHFNHLKFTTPRILQRFLLIGLVLGLSGGSAYAMQSIVKRVGKKAYHALKKPKKPNLGQPTAPPLGALGPSASLLPPSKMAAALPPPKAAILPSPKALSLPVPKLTNQLDDVVNAKTAYQKYFQPGPNGLITGSKSTDLSALAQYQRDVAMWYSTLKHTSPETQGVLSRAFSAMHHGGLKYRHPTGQWTQWGAGQALLASALSHGGRVVYELPKGSGNQFWNWLWGGAQPQKRLAGTHSVKILKTPEILADGTQKWTREVRVLPSQLWSHWKNRKQHFGIDLPFGGEGMINPLSGKRIVPDGTHGHLYINYVKPTKKKPGSIMIGLEGSTPADRFTRVGDTQVRRSSKWRAFKNIITNRYAPDQGMERHVFPGKVTKQSPTGGKKWTHMKEGPTSAPTKGGSGVDMMHVKINDDFLEKLPKLEFTPEMLGGRGLAR